MRMPNGSLEYSSHKGPARRVHTAPTGRGRASTSAVRVSVFVVKRGGCRHTCQAERYQQRDPREQEEQEQKKVGMIVDPHAVVYPGAVAGEHQYQKYHRISRGLLVMARDASVAQHTMLAPQRSSDHAVCTKMTFVVNIII